MRRTAPTIIAFPVPKSKLGRIAMIYALAFLAWFISQQVLAKKTGPEPVARLLAPATTQVTAPAAAPSTLDKSCGVTTPSCAAAPESK